MLCTSKIKERYVCAYLGGKQVANGVRHIKHLTFKEPQ